MKEYVIAEKSELTAIAEAIREKTSSTETYSIAEMVTAISQIEGGGSAEVEYIIGTPVAATLAVSAWNGSRYDLKLDNYKVGSFGIQIGIPSDSSVINTQALIEAALTVSDYGSAVANTENGTPASVSIVIAAVNTPSTELSIWIFGLEAA
jgi:hypothetical protein